MWMLVIEFQVASNQVPMKRPGQPAELATAYVMLAELMSSYVSGATIAVTGGKPML
jgi:NAD(P)-dependent dehydrogenase (short-subunit alcohol dehydrogenase family)